MFCGAFSLRPLQSQPCCRVILQFIFGFVAGQPPPPAIPHHLFRCVRSPGVTDLFFSESPTSIPSCPPAVGHSGRFWPKIKGLWPKIQKCVRSGGFKNPLPPNPGSKWVFSSPSSSGGAPPSAHQDRPGNPRHAGPGPANAQLTQPQPSRRCTGSLVISSHPMNSGKGERAAQEWR